MLPVTERVSASTLALPFYVQLEDDDIAYVASALREVLAEQ
jgi:dTDP-4-amino-4,6-dideoxygalactose transaminase